MRGVGPTDWVAPMALIVAFVALVVAVVAVLT